MISRSFKIGLIVFAAVACVAVFALARLDSATLRQRVAFARKQKEQTEQLKVEKTKRLDARAGQTA
jgi:hypothetical protein